MSLDSLFIVDSFSYSERKQDYYRNTAGNFGLLQSGQRGFKKVQFFYQAAVYLDRKRLRFAPPLASLNRYSSYQK